MMVYFLAFLMLGLALGAAIVAARVVATLPHSVLARAEESGRYAGLGSDALGPPVAPASGGRLRTLLPVAVSPG